MRFVTGLIALLVVSKQLATARHSHMLGAVVFLAVACGGGNSSQGSAGAAGSAGSSQAIDTAGAGSGGTSAGGSTAGTGGTNNNQQAARLALGAQYGCVIASSGSIVCWGTPSVDVGETDSPTGVFTSLSASTQGEVTCGIDSSAQPVCWGNVAAALADPIPAGLNAVSIDVGSSEQCVVNRDGSISCWGTGLPQQPSGPFQQVGVGTGFACALRVDGTIACWGTASKSTNAPAGAYVELQTGGEHSCARAQDGSVTCWGLGDATDNNDGTQGAWGQAIAPAGVKFTALALGQVTSCGILASGDVQCWGAGKTRGDCSTPDTCGQALAQSGPFTEIAVGYTNACGILTSGKIKCWGSNTGGRSTPPAQFQ